MVSAFLAIIRVKNLQMFQKTEHDSCTVMRYASSVITYSFVQIMGIVHFLKRRWLHSDETFQAHSSILVHKTKYQKRKKIGQA